MKFNLADRRELVLTSARLRRADKLTPELKEINIKSNIETPRERGICAKPLANRPFPCSKVLFKEKSVRHTGQFTSN